MKDYKSGSHTIWGCKYHIVWVTKYRYDVLEGRVVLRFRELLREIAHHKEMHIYGGNVTDEVWKKYIEEQKPN